MSKKVNPIFVTGATGFVGSHLARRLVKEGQSVHLLVRKSSDISRIKDILEHVVLHEGDLADKKSITKIIREVKPKGIYHLAAQTIMLGVPALPEEVTSANFIGTMNLLSALETHEYDFFIASGSCLEYKPPTRPISEDDVCEPTEVYGITKLAATLYTKLIGEKGKPAFVFRFFTPYGPQVQKGKLIEQVITHALVGEDFFLTKASTARDFIYIDDLVSLLLEGASQADKHKGQIFNAGSGAKTTIGDLAADIVVMTGSKSNVVWRPEKASIYDSDFWQADMTKTFSSFSWRPSVSLTEGLQKTIEYFKKLKKS